MLKSILTPALIALSLSGAAFAGNNTTSNDAQLARSAGVAPGAYSASELVNIIDARNDNDQIRLNYYLSGANRTSASVQGDSSNQLARIVGVQPGAYSAAELTQVIEARKDNDREGVNFILSGSNRATPAAADFVSPGKVQLAAVLGLDPSQYTLAQLAQLTADAND